MSFSKGINASVSTNSKNRTPGSISPFSGMCSTCSGDCPGLCEVGKSAFRGREMLYPQPFGNTTFASEKDYPVDLSHFNIMGTAVGAYGIEADSDKAIFHNVNTGLSLGKKNELKLKMPLVIAGMGSTKVAADNWEGLAAGAALSGTIIVVGENVCGMDSGAEFKNGTVSNSPELKRRIDSFNKWYNGYGIIAVQTNVEDTGFGVAEYAIKKLGVKAIELKWGQGAKSIGGEVKIDTLKKALELKSRGYLVYPDPEDPRIQELFNKGAVREFERHSRIGMVNEENFLQRVKELRKLGAKYIFLKTGAYRPRDLANAVKLASEAKIDLLTIDGAGGGTGMSPWRMMNEWGIPTVYLAALTYQYMKILDESGCYLPPVALAGGFSLEDHIFKTLALGSPYFKLVGMARAPLTATMVGNNLGKMIESGTLAASIAKSYGVTVGEVFAASHTLKEELGDDFDRLSCGGIGLYTYFSRLMTGLQQLMTGARKFSPEYIQRDDIAALTEEAGKVTGIKYIMDLDSVDAEQILKRRLSAVM